MKRLCILSVVALTLCWATMAQAQQLFDITAPGDPVVGMPDDADWPGNEAPPLAIDDVISGAKYLHFIRTEGVVTGFRVTPSVQGVVVKAINLAAANDCDGRDPATFQLSGSTDGIDGPYTLIAEGTIDDFGQATAWTRNEWISAPVEIKNGKAYDHYELLFPTIRSALGGCVNSMQIGEVELLSDGSKGGAASNPDPAAEVIDVPRDVVLSWVANETAVTHDLYFGTVFDDVNEASTGDPLGVLVSPGQTDTSLDMGRLEFGQTYFWRVDEVNGAPDFAVFKGDIWSFTIEPTGRPIENITATASSSNSDTMGPEKTIDGSGLGDMDQHSTLATDMWLSGMGDATPSIQYEFDKAYKLYQFLVWNSNQMIESFVGLGAKDVTIEYSLDGTDWVALEGPIQFNQAPGAETYTANTIIDFGGVMARFVKLTVNAGWGMLPQYGLSEVRFLYIPAFARLPEPVDGSLVSSANVELSWRAGREAASHEISLGTNAADLAQVATTSDPTYMATGLDYSTTYFWSITEVNEAEAITSFAGDVWSFITPDFGTVDDFEAYDDNCNRIFFAWEDGIGHNGGTEIDGCDVPPSNGNGGGSIVGNDLPPFAEQTIVNSGNQSLPFNYDNAFGVSETTLALGGQDWTASSIQTLSLAFRGSAGNTGTLYVKINNTEVTYDGPAINMGRATWQVWNIVLADTGAGLSSVNSLTIGVDGAGAAGMLYIDDIRLYAEIFEAAGAVDITTPGDTIQGVPNDGDWPAAEAPEFAIDNDSATKYLHRKGGSELTGFQIAPVAGSTVVTELTLTTANDDFGRDPTSFELSGSNSSIDGPYTLIAAGEIVDFAQATVWPRFTKNATPITFDNSVAYTYYQIVFPSLRANNTDGLMQIAEVELVSATLGQ